VVQPVWGDDGSLWFLCDRTDVWSLYRCRAGGEAELVLDVGSDIAGPQWVFGQSRFALLDDGRVALTYPRDGAGRLAVLDPGERPRELPLPYATWTWRSSTSPRAASAWPTSTTGAPPATAAATARR
jgi:hypothetical protein